MFIIISQFAFVSIPRTGFINLKGLSCVQIIGSNRVSIPRTGFINLKDLGKDAFVHIDLVSIPRTGFINLKAEESIVWADRILFQSRERDSLI